MVGRRTVSSKAVERSSGSCPVCALPNSFSMTHRAAPASSESPQGLVSRSNPALLPLNWVIPSI